VSQTRSTTDRVYCSDQAATSSSSIVNLALPSVSASEESFHLHQESTGGIVQRAPETPAFERGTRTVESQNSVDEACRELSSFLKRLIEKKKLPRDYRFILDHYRSTFEQEPNNAITVTDVESLKHFLNRTESKFRADAIALEKSCQALQALTDEYQKNKDIDRQLLHKRMNREESSGLLEEESVRSRKKRSFQKMKVELEELDAKLKGLSYEKYSLHVIWQAYEAMERHKLRGIRDKNIELFKL